MRKSTKYFIASDGKLRVGNVVETKTLFPGSSSSFTTFVYCLQRRKSEGVKTIFCTLCYRSWEGACALFDWSTATKKGRSLGVGHWEFIGQLTNKCRDNGYSALTPGYSASSFCCTYLLSPHSCYTLPPHIIIICY